MLVCGIDPDTNATGIAVLNTALDPLPFATKWGLYSVRAQGKTFEDRRDRMARALGELPIQWHLLDLVAVEWPWIVPGLKYGDRRVRPNDIVNLGAVAGMILAAGAARAQKVICPRPHEWRGTVPKDVVQARALRDSGLTLEAPEFAGILPSMRSHVVDAIGLAVWLKNTGGTLGRMR